MRGYRIGEICCRLDAALTGEMMRAVTASHHDKVV